MQARTRYMENEVLLHQKMYAMKTKVQNVSLTPYFKSFLPQRPNLEKLILLHVHPNFKHNDFFPYQNDEQAFVPLDLFLFHNRFSFHDKSCLCQGSFFQNGR